MSWSEADIPDQSGRTVVITGVSAGIGAELSKAFARKGAEVVLAVRNVSKGKKVADQIQAVVPGAPLHALELDLSSLASIRSFAAEYQHLFEQLDLLINNAGIYNNTEKTEDGFGLMMGVNHLGHFALTGLLIEQVLAAPSSRVVTLSSGAHRRGRIDLGRFHTPEAGAKGAYGNSKLANMLFMLELHRRLAAIGSSTASVAAGPGPTKTDGARTGIQSISFSPLRWMADKLTDAIMLSPHDGMLPVLRAATDPAIASGEYCTLGGFISMRGQPEVKELDGAAIDRALAAELWDRSVELTDVTYGALAS